MSNDLSTLNSMAVGGKYDITSDIMRDVQHSKHFQTSLQSSFFSFIGSTDLARSQITADMHRRLRQVFSIGLIIKHSPNDFLNGLMLKEFSNNKHKSEYLTLLQNAFIYAVVACYKSQIKKTYMLASEKSSRTEAQNIEYMLTSKVGGRYLVGSPDDVAKHSDEAYIEYVVAQHPLFTKIVKSKHFFQYKKILAVVGYLINPNLDKR